MHHSYFLISGSKPTEGSIFNETSDGSGVYFYNLFFIFRYVLLHLHVSSAPEQKSRSISLITDKC